MGTYYYPIVIFIMIKKHELDTTHGGYTKHLQLHLQFFQQIDIRITLFNAGLNVLASVCQQKKKSLKSNARFVFI